MEETTWQVQGKVKAVTCDHDKEQQGMVATGQSEKAMLHLKQASTIQLYK